MSPIAPNNHADGMAQDTPVSSMSETSDRERMKALIARLIAWRAEGNVENLVACAAPDVVFKTARGRSHPFHTEYRGLEACANLARQVNVIYENLGSRLNKLLIEGERVAVHRTARIRNRGTGRAVDVDIWDFIRFRDGLIVEISEYPDTEAFEKLDYSDD